MAVRKLINQLKGPSFLVLITLATTGIGACGTESTREPANGLYKERHRPQFHFTPPAMWMNDPNGMVYLDGEYHLFYQYYPDDTVWGPMHWGHAISRDLVHWEHLPIALYPDELGYIFSGSAVVDWNNTSGFGDGDQPPLVAIFTYHDPVRGKAGTNDHETQGIAYSVDRGRTWTKFDGNPVLPNVDRHKDFRDPKVFWHAPGSRWIMALSAFDHVQFWASKDLKSWQHLSDFGHQWGAHGGTWECPDLFELPVEGTDEKKWVLLLNLNPGGPQGGSGTQYFVGDFDGTTFALDETFAETLGQQEAVWLDWGRDNYAGVTWSDVPATDGRRIFIGWMSNWDYSQQVPTHPWRSAMTLPRTLQLKRTAEGYRVTSTPVRELEALRRNSVKLPRQAVTESVDVTGLISFPVSMSEILLRFDKSDSPSADFGIVLSNNHGEEYRIGYDGSTNTFYSDRRNAGDNLFSDKFADRIHRAPRENGSDIVAIRLFLDMASVELFADAGETVMTDIFFPTSPFERLALYSNDSRIRLIDGEVLQLGTIWK
ncbi:MAG: glycoside hydrolase family 32 protein [Woeseiaceae bacterium]